MTMIRNMSDRPGGGAWVAGACAKCRKPVYESLRELDDTFNVWAGRCPHCDALNFLSRGPNEWRGYDNDGMRLELPTDEEARDNALPPGTPTRGPGGPTEPYGTNASAVIASLTPGRKIL